MSSFTLTLTPDAVTLALTASGFAALKQVIVATLKANAGITALVGDRITPNMIPQSTPPGAAAISYRFISAVRGSHLTGPDGWPLTRVRFRVQSARLADVEALKKRIRNLWQGIPAASDDIRIAFVSVENESDGYAWPVSGSDVGTHYAEFDLRFKSQEPLPTHS